VTYRRFLAIVFLVLFAAGLVPVRADDMAKIAKQVDKVFAEYDRQDSPGCGLGVIRDGRLIYERGYGMANLEYGIPITSSSIFRTGSVAKQFTAMATALLAEQGKISLDDDIRKHLPEMPDYGPPVTVRHLIHHTSGVRDYLELMRLAGYGNDDHYTDEDVVNKLARQKELNFATGSVGADSAGVC
jgi:CubicO group peptidase (beta-lactamase class C family)